MSGYSHSADFLYIEHALQDAWEPFIQLEDEMTNFKPKSIDEYDDFKESELNRLQELNPSKTREDLLVHVQTQIDYMSSFDSQFYSRFDRRHMNQYITVISLSHSLCEALINTALAVGLNHVGATDLFQLLEKNDLKKKWVYGPKSFCPEYSFPIGGALHESLVNLIKFRNALVHYKVEFTVDDSKLLDGVCFRRDSYKEERVWLRRYFSLPYDLSNFLFSSIEKPKVMVLHQRGPIEIFSAHAV